MVFFLQWYSFYAEKFANHAALLTDELQRLGLMKKGKFKFTHPPLRASKKKEIFQKKISCMRIMNRTLI